MIHLSQQGRHRSHQFQSHSVSLQLPQQWNFAYCWNKKQSTGWWKHSHHAKFGYFAKEHCYILY